MPINDPGSPWAQLSSLFFFLSGWFGDVLLIRMFLVLAYFFLTFNAWLGFPFWPDFVSFDPWNVSVDVIVWNSCNIYVHGSALVRLLMDEREVYLDGLEESLWRMFYRRSGISKVVFKKQLVPILTMHVYQPGECIPQREGKKNLLHIIYKGNVQGDILNSDGSTSQIMIESGDIFHIKYLAVFGIAIGFKDQVLHTTAISEVTCFSFYVHNLHILALSSLAARNAWQSLVATAFARVAERPWNERETTIPEVPVIDPCFEELLDFEIPENYSPGSGKCYYNPCSNLFHTMCNSFSPPWPFSSCSYGIRMSNMSPPLDPNYTDRLIRAETQEPGTLRVAVAE